MFWKEEGAFLLQWFNNESRHRATGTRIGDKHILYIECYLLYLGSLTSGRYKTQIFKEGFKGKIF